MSDYSARVSLLRGDISSMLTEDLEHTPWVLADVADGIQPGTANFDDFMDQVQTLSDAEKQSLMIFCDRVAYGLKGE